MRIGVNGLNMSIASASKSPSALRERSNPSLKIAASPIEVSTSMEESAVEYGGGSGAKAIWTT